MEAPRSARCSEWFTSEGKAGLSVDPAFHIFTVKRQMRAAVKTMFVSCFTHSSPALPSSSSSLSRSFSMTFPVQFAQQFKLSPLLLLSLSLSDLLVSSSCDITGHRSPLGLDIRPRCQATAVKGLSASVCECSMCVYVCS